MDKAQSLLLELDQLKAVYRKSYLSDGSRHENSAEHSWHLAMALMALKTQLPETLDFNKAIQMALVHDVCEIGAGDVCAYHATNSQPEDEKKYLFDLTQRHNEFGAEVFALWQEYEMQNTIESQWVKVVDKLLPFILNLSTHGRTWKEQSITGEMIRAHNLFIKGIAPQIYAWMLQQLDQAVESGWVLNE